MKKARYEYSGPGIGGIGTVRTVLNYRFLSVVVLPNVDA